MDVPFLSSGAMSRAHYALVRKVETAPSSHAADAVLYAEVEVIQNRLLHSTLTLKQVKESLVILLYCCTAVYPDVTLDVLFALPHAISLAEAGKTVQDKRIGYLFCVEVMPRNHELQLMLVNTLRKDLESAIVPRICLALDTIIHFAPEDVYPAIQNRLYGLISHTSPHIRRRTLLAFRTLSQQNTDILKSILDKMRKRLNDEDLSVVNAALTLSIVLMNAKLMSSDRFHPILTKLFRRMWNARADQNARALLIKIMQTVLVVGSSAEDFEIMQDIVHSRIRGVSSMNAMKYQCFLIAASHPNSVTPSTSSAFIKGTRHLLVSEDINDIYTFITCLICLDPALWAGTAETPAVLEGWEVERVMNLLDSTDALIRTRTLHVLLRVDRSVVEGYYEKLSSSLGAQADNLKCCLEAVKVLSGEDGETYAQHVVHLLSLVDNDISRRHVLQDAVEETLTYVRNADVEFRIGCLGTLFTVLGEKGEEFGPTLMTIMAALVCEYLDSCPVPPEKLLQSISRALPSYFADLQEACLLSMIRLSANCESSPEDVLQIVRKVQESAGRQIKRRCDQFATLSQDKVALAQIVTQAKSPTLPEFLMAVEAYRPPGASYSVHSSPSLISPGMQEGSRSSSRASINASKLRYAAYDAPRPTPRLRRVSSSSSRSSGAQSPDLDELLSKTVTAGDLALASGRRDLQELARSPLLSSTSPVRITMPDELASQVDLLGLDSPFISEPPVPTISNGATELNFEKIWDALANANTRGWCEVTIDVVVRKLQSMQHIMRVIASDQPPFKGDLKIILSPSFGHTEHHGIAVLRLKESDDESCLWHLRCADEALRSHIKELLTDIEQ